jgi:hypothetical protein
MESNEAKGKIVVVLWAKTMSSDHTVLPSPEMAERLSSQPALHDGEDLEELPLLLRSADVSALIEVAEQQGLTAARLARRLICDCLRQTRVMRCLPR